MGDEYNDGYGLEDWDIPFTDLEFGQLVGKGNFGCVWAGEYVGTPVAIKKVEQQGVDKLPAEYILDSETALKYFRRELTVLKSIHHPNVVQFMGTAVSGDSVYIVTEWVGGGDLRKLIKKKQIPVTWKERTEIARETAIAMAYLHVKKLIHRDLKPANLLLTEHGRIKVCDLGLARTIESTEKGEGKKYYTIAGTDVWMAPEVIMGDSYDFKCDVFSFGCILYNLIKRHSPPRRKPANAFTFEEDVMMADIPKGCPQVLIQMMKECLAYEPEKRPNFRELAARLKVLVNELPDQDEEEEQKTIEIDGVEVEIESLLKVNKEQQEKEKQQQQGITGGSIAVPPPLSQSKVLPGSSVTPPPSSSQLPPWPEEEEPQPQQPQQQQPQQQPQPQQPQQPSVVGNGSVAVVKQSKIAPPPGGSVVKPAASVPQAESEGEKEFLEEDLGGAATSSDLEGRNTRFAVLFKALREKEGKGGRKKLQLEDTALGPETKTKPAGTPQNEVRRNKRFAALLAMVKPEDN